MLGHWQDGALTLDEAPIESFMLAAETEVAKRAAASPQEGTPAGQKKQYLSKGISVAAMVCGARRVSLSLSLSLFLSVCLPSFCSFLLSCFCCQRRLKHLSPSLSFSDTKLSHTLLLPPELEREEHLLAHKNSRRSTIDEYSLRETKLLLTIDGTRCCVTAYGRPVPPLRSTGQTGHTRDAAARLALGGVASFVAHLPAVTAHREPADAAAGHC